MQANRRTKRLDSTTCGDDKATVETSDDSHAGWCLLLKRSCVCFRSDLIQWCFFSTLSVLVRSTVLASLSPVRKLVKNIHARHQTGILAMHCVAVHARVILETRATRGYRCPQSGKMAQSCCVDSCLHKTWTVLTMEFKLSHFWCRE